MIEGESRPSPEEMLERARAEESARKRGRLKIFFGAAPGVGKTYAMLEAARARRSEGVDVVVGWIETHGRRETEALAEGLERIPPRTIEYRGVTLREIDLDAALARRPGLILVDELAHTNAPGSKHARRWRDVLELLDAGVDVYSTLNVQHLESLNDVVAQITRVAVRETVPDSIFEQAVDVELVDLTPDDLLQRLHEGKVYFPAQAERAVESFFQKGNLIALRELALRRTAERVDAQMTRWKSDHGISQPWPASERILVAIGPAPRSADLVRAAFRMATRLRAPWIGLSIESPDFQRLPQEDRDRVKAHLTLAEQLGAEPLVVAADDVAEAILSVARQRNVSRIVVGKPASRTLRDRLWGSLVDRVARGSGPIDVLVTSGEEERSPRGARPQPRKPTPRREYAWGAGVVALVTAVCWIAWPVLALADQAMLYLVGVLFVSSRFSRGPALLVSLLSVAALDFFFTPPYLTLAVADASYVITFGVMLATGLLVRRLTLRIREQAEASREREQRTAILYTMTRSFAFRSGVSDLAEATARHIEILFELEASVLLGDASGGLVHRGGAAGRFVESESELAVARWVFQHGRPAGHGTDTLPEAQGLFLPIGSTTKTLGVLGLALGARAQDLTPSQRQILDVFVSHAALAIERALLSEEAERSRVVAEAERLRSTLLSSVSHDLRTPLSAVTGAATSLLDDAASLDAGSRHDLLETIREEADRLNRVVGGILEITRLESGAVTLRKEWYPLEEIIGSALARLERPLSSREVKVDLPGEILQVHADAILVEQVLVNLLENAAKYTPPGSPIEIAAAEREGRVEIEVRDRGPGIPPGEETRIFERFHRAAEAGARGGTGLGLAVCQAAVAAHGGSIRAESREDGGAVFSFTLPTDALPFAPAEVLDRSHEA